jgi:hypothetical protein
LPKYCCFLCPAFDYTVRTLQDACPDCGNPYGFPLFSHPTTLADYTNISPLSRGFYSATFIAERGRLRQKYVLKVAAKAVYAFFKKDFAAECELHRDIATQTEHVVPIIDMFDDDVNFGGTIVPCHVAVLAYVEGVPLEQLLLSPDPIPSRRVAQIAIDLFRIIEELEAKGIRHNDLHAGNVIIETFKAGAVRHDAVDERVRAIAIDLGSAGDASKSDPQSERYGDVHWVAHHLQGLARRLLREPERSSDLEYRLATVLQERAQLLAPAASLLRAPSAAQCAQDIRAAVDAVSRPWQEPPRLRDFAESYNAQTLSPWFVPKLLVDPDDEWVNRVSVHGPQVILGMRGCGKTMLLRSLQFHARATATDNEPANDVLARLEKDNFVGLYASATRLLDKLGTRADKLSEPYARLYSAYALGALQAVTHLKDIQPFLVAPATHTILAEAVDDFLKGEHQVRAAVSEQQLERRLIALTVALASGDKGFVLSAHPSIAFPHLAAAIRRCSPLWSNATILYLLDDVSTRYLNESEIEELLSSLMFMTTSCAFKITTEAQTLEFAKSPGQNDPARVGRDYSVFDLGAEVNQKLRERAGTGGRGFLEKILGKRSTLFPQHPPHPPRVILGDGALSTLAAKIASTRKTAREKKDIYHGLSALAAVCVGDIGDVISIYDLILKRDTQGEYPIGRGIQSDCYQDFCSRRLYELNRRDTELKDFALTFAEASHELLRKSHQDVSGKKDQRLRQYLKLYVRITTGDTSTQFRRLRELIDAGVFILAGGSDTPRTKNKDSDPIQQFVLTYRKLFGLSNFIGLAERDRFELSGQDLEDWLKNPSAGKTILMRNLGGPAEGSDDEEFESELSPVDANDQSDARQPYLFGMEATQGAASINGAVTFADLTAWTEPRAIEISESVIRSMRVDSVVLGLGFEERSVDAVKRWVDLCRPTHVVAIKYREPGFESQILETLHAWTKDIQVVEYADVIERGLPSLGGTVLVDVAGLAKAALFHAIRDPLRQSGRVWVCHTSAEKYYPLETDIAKVIKAEETKDHYSLLAELAKILTGEQGPYQCRLLFGSDSDPTRRRVLCAFSSAKHERLLSLLDRRDYDAIEIIVPNSESARSQFGRLAADVAAQNFQMANINEIDSDDVNGVLQFMCRRYQQWYGDSGFNFELGLTGSKMQAVACAAVAATLKVTAVWYVTPHQFDPRRFTGGVGATTYYEVSTTRG